MASETTTEKTVKGVTYIRGFPFPASSRFKKENILSALNYRPKDDDFIISSYPKTGTTWVEYIILQIIHRGQVFPSMVELNHKLVPFLERTGAAAAEALEPPRMVKFHLPFHLIPYNDKARYLYVIRNPKDVAVSFYHFRREAGDDDGPFDDFFNAFLSGEVPFGSYLEHVKSWYARKEDPNVFIMYYEQLCADTRSQILRLAKFLGEEHYTALLNDPELFDKVLTKTSFGHMSKNLAVKFPASDVNAATPIQKTVKFFRKGTPGDWKNYLSLEQNSLLENKMKEVFGEDELFDMWK